MSFTKIQNNPFITFVNLRLGLRLGWGLKDYHYVTDMHESQKCCWFLEGCADRISLSVFQMRVFINVVREHNPAGLPWDN